MVINGNALNIPLADGSVHCIVTSPPYWGLRNYGIDNQLGLERTPEEYVANMVQVFRECWRVLRDDGVLWLNLGDSYNGSGGAGGDYSNGGLKDGQPKYPGRKIVTLKPKDLVGIPWLVAKALQAPFYTGKIHAERDRVWLAAMIDSEGCICGFTHVRKDNGATRTGVHIQITNSNMRLLDEATRIWPASITSHMQPGEGHIGLLETFRWIAHDVDEKSILVAELYPYLIAKRKQALLAWNFFEMSKDAKRLGKGSEAEAVREKRAFIVNALSDLNHLREVDIPSWCKEPPSLYEPGWYLRSDVIWSKPNPMPESVTDRPTKSHEYLFLLAKRERYYYDAEAIREKADTEPHTSGWKTTPHETGIRQLNRANIIFGIDGNRNRRTVWTIPTAPYSGAHFATFPPALVEPCIKAGTSERGVCPKCGKGWKRHIEKVGEFQRRWSTNNAEGSPYKNQSSNQNIYSDNGWLPTCPCGQDNGGALTPIPALVFDPFAGSGTTIKVAYDLGRRGVGLDLSMAYLTEQATTRIHNGHTARLL